MVQVFTSTGVTPAQIRTVRLLAETLVFDAVAVIVTVPPAGRVPEGEMVSEAVPVKIIGFAVTPNEMLGNVLVAKSVP